MTKKNQIKITLWCVLTCFSITLIHAIHIRIERNNLLKKGTETVGIVTYANISKPTKITHYTVDFSFFKDDTVIDMRNSLDIRNTLPGGKIEFQKAIVGYTYRVRYFNDKPLKKARIYMDEPVSVSDEDYMKLLERAYVKQQQVEKSKTWWKNF
ncbi:MAG: hypothetical protein J6P73_04150 [Bacteroidales bacterium]|nr:hypothetical protein [Bacteroidales bacterium]